MEMRSFSLLRIFTCLCLYCIVPYGNSLEEGLPYDYSATIQCISEPWNAQYGGGIITNPAFNNGTEGWTVFGEGKMKESTTSKDGNNRFIVAYDRKHPTDSFSQKVQLKKGYFYAFSAWVQVSKGRETVCVVFKTPNGILLHGGRVTAEQGCWSMLKGGIVSNFSGSASVFFQSKNTHVDIWADNIALQPFTEKQWRSDQQESIEKVRKSNIKFQTSSMNTTITLKQTNPSFPFGCEINKNILTSMDYQNWFTSRFTATAFGNEMKWYSTETTQGQENYTIPDAMLEFTENHNISVRGHNVFWDNPIYQPDWVPTLSKEELEEAVEKHMESVVSRYKGKVIAWDVVNENLHFRFFEDKLGENASAAIYAKVHTLDPEPILFMNEYNTIEYKEDEDVSPAKYVEKLKSIVAYPGGDELPMGIGLQSRFGPGQPNLVYMRAGMDLLAATGYPLWLTEMFVDKGDNQSQYLEEVLREGYSHPAVKGIVIWPTSPFSDDCKMCLIDKDFHNTPTGDVVDKLIREWGLKGSEIAFQCDRFCEVDVFHGNYVATVWHPRTNHRAQFELKVTEDSNDSSVYLQLDSMGKHASNADNK